jgi:hypothetical protein|tara:strand:+ start:4412 stop:5839 length:1428 start_codon:yes stop_codon:yes gene_type:complete
MVKVTEIEDTMQYTPRQREFMYYAIEDDSISDLYFCGGVRSGKSVCVVKAGWHTAMRFPESHGLLTRATLKELKSATLDSTVYGKDANGEQVIPLDTIADHNKDAQQIIFKNGSKWSYFGMDQIERFQGMEFSYWMGEEANRYKINVFNYVRNTRICNRVGPHKIFLNSNTDTGQDHLYQRFFEENREGHKAIVVSTLENAKHLPQSFLKDLEILKKRDPLSYAVYIMAKFQGLSGLVYPQFNSLIHVVEPFEIPREWKRVKGFDHGFAHYCGALAVAVDFEGNLWCYDEYAEKGRSIPENASALTSEKGWTKFEYADPSVYKQYTQSSKIPGKMVFVGQDYRDNGIELTPANNSKAGIERIRAFLYVDPEKIHPILQTKGSPRIFFFRGRVPTTIKQIANWKLRSDSDGMDTEEPEDGDDDLPDCLKYIVNGNPCAHIKGMADAPKEPWELAPWERGGAQAQQNSDFIFSPELG